MDKWLQLLTHNPGGQSSIPPRGEILFTLVELVFESLKVVCRRWEWECIEMKKSTVVGFDPRPAAAELLCPKSLDNMPQYSQTLRLK